MSNNSSQPRKDDAILGDRRLIVSHTPVLGGIGGVKKRLSSTDKREQNIALEDAFRYGRAGLDIIIATFNNERSHVANKAWSLFKRYLVRVSEEEQIELLQDVLKYDKEGLEIVVAALKSQRPAIERKAWELLSNRPEMSVRDILEEYRHDRKQ